MREIDLGGSSLGVFRTQFKNIREVPLIGGVVDEVQGNALELDRREYDLFFSEERPVQEIRTDMIDRRKNIWGIFFENDDTIEEKSREWIKMYAFQGEFTP